MSGVRTKAAASGGVRFVRFRDRKPAELLLAHRHHRHGAPPGTPKPASVSPQLCRGVSSLYCVYSACRSPFEKSQFLPVRNVTTRPVDGHDTPLSADTPGIIRRPCTRPNHAHDVVPTDLRPLGMVVLRYIAEYNGNGGDSAGRSGDTMPRGPAFVGRPGTSRLFGGRCRAGSCRRLCGANAACCSFTNASIAPSRLFSTIAPGRTVRILSNTRNGSVVPSNRIANRPSG